METPPSPPSWFSQLPKWFKATVAAVTGMVGFVLVARDNFKLYVVAFVVVAWGWMIYGCFRILTARVNDGEGKPTVVYRYARYRRLAYVGIGMSVVTASLLLLRPVQDYVTVAIAGEPTPTAMPTATVTPAPPETSTPTPSPTPIAFAPAAEGETLILVARFHSTTATNTEPDVKIRRRIAEELAELGETQVRVEVEPTTLRADERDAAERLGEIYQASIVIWGEDTGVETVVNYLNLRQPDFDAANAQIVEREATQLANPQAYAKFITQDLPGQITFLSLFAIAQSYYLNVEYGRAIEVLERAIESIDGMANVSELGLAYFRLGWLYQQPPIEMPANAILNYDRAIQLDPDDPAAYYNRGNAYLDLEEWAQAVKDYDQAIEIDPEYAKAYNNRGNAYDELGEWEQAIADFTKSIEYDPGSPVPHGNRGWMYMLLLYWDLALHDFNRAIELAPEDAFTYSDRGELYFRQTKYDLAILDYGKAIFLRPNEAYFYYQRGKAYGAQLLHAQAVEDYSQALRFNIAKDIATEIATDITIEEVYHQRGMAYFWLGEWQLAIDDLDHGLAPNPDETNVFPYRATAYYYQGIAYQRLGNWERAIEDFHQVILVNDHYDETHDALCWAYGLEQQPALALPHCNRAIEINPMMAYHLSRGLVHSLLNDFDAAIADFAFYLENTSEITEPKIVRMREQCEAWVAMLRAGDNPFTPNLLDALRQDTEQGLISWK